MKLRTTIAALGCLGLAACALGNTAHADAQTKTTNFPTKAVADANKTTEVDVSIASGGLILNQPTNMKFDVALTGQKQVIPDKAKSKISISDYRGLTSTGWKVTAKLSGDDFGGLGLTLKPESKAGYVKVPDQRFSLNGQEIEIASVPSDKMSIEDINTDIDLNTELNVPASIATGEHKNTIVWDIQEAPTY